MTPQEIVDEAERVLKSIQACGHYACFEYVGTSVGYHSDEDQSFQWIARFFEGYFLPTDNRDTDGVIYCTADRALVSLLKELSTQRALSKDEYVDTPLTDNVAVIYTRATKVTPREDVYYLLFKKERRIVLVTSGALEVRQEEGMQTLRSFIKWLLIERGWIPLHAACAAKGKRAVCVTGAKSSGKTSTLLNLLARNGCDLVAVDKVLIYDAGLHVDVCGIPGKAGVRVGSAVGHPQILNWLTQEESDPFFPHMTVEEVRQIAEVNTLGQLRERKEKIVLLPTELARLFGASITPIAPLELVLVPVFDLDVDESRLTSCSGEQAFDLLLESYGGLLRKGEGFLLHLFDLSDAGLRERLGSLLRKHLRSIPVYGLHQNHTTNEHSAALVAGLTG